MTIGLGLADTIAFLGLAGMVIALVSAVVAAVAFAIIGAPSEGGAAMVGWLVGLMLSLCGGFGGDWYLPALAVAALPLFLALAGAIGLLRAALQH